jgi:hypothetical protein
LQLPAAAGFELTIFARKQHTQVKKLNTCSMRAYAMLSELKKQSKQGMQVINSCSEMNDFRVRNRDALSAEHHIQHD